MAARPPVPYGSSREDIDAGTLARLPTPSPGPVELWLVAPMPFLAKAAKKRIGITVNAQSQIKGAQWNEKIDASKHAPSYIQDHISWQDGRFAPTKKFVIPSDQQRVDWDTAWQAGVESSTWELTTQHMELTVDRTGQVTQKRVIHLSPGESVWGELTTTAPSIDDSDLELGRTYEKGLTGIPKWGAYLKSHRGLITVVTRIELDLKGDYVHDHEVIDVDDETLVHMWLHEIALHAGRIEQHRPNTHRDPWVNDQQEKMRDMFKPFDKPDAPNDSYRRRVAAFIQRFLNAEKLGDDSARLTKSLLDSHN